MSIEEKPQLLEFNCTLDGMKEITWNVKYDPNNKIGLHISGNGQDFHCPVELFGDVTNFLRSKNIIKPDINVRTVKTPGIMPGPFVSALMPPKIENVAPVEVQQPSTPSGPPADALSSFDITSLPDTSVVKEAGSVVSSPAVTPEVKSEVINRPVIRSRVTDGDPQSAEKEAAAIRGVGGDKKSIIRKKHKE